MKNEVFFTYKEFPPPFPLSFECDNIAIQCITGYF